jgi:shikimate kinase
VVLVVLVVLVGLPGTGKSTVGREVARRLGVSFSDTDEMLGEAPGALLRRVGEPAFRERERTALATALSRGGVVATGGGVVTTEEGRRALAGVPCVWLRATPGTLARRTGAVDRPQLEGDPSARLAALAAEREPLYDALARARVDAERPLAEVIEAVVTLVGEWSSCE